MSSFTRKHNCIGTFTNSNGNIWDFCSCGRGMSDHALKHVRSHDNWLPHGSARSNNLSLQRNEDFNPLQWAYRHYDSSHSTNKLSMIPENTPERIQECKNDQVLRNYIALEIHFYICLFTRSPRILTCQKISRWANYTSYLQKRHFLNWQLSSKITSSNHSLQETRKKFQYETFALQQINNSGSKYPSCPEDWHGTTWPKDPDTKIRAGIIKTYTISCIQNWLQIRDWICTFNLHNHMNVGWLFCSIDKTY